MQKVTKGTAVRVRTREQLSIVINKMRLFGWKWWNGTMPNEKDADYIWCDLADNACIPLIDGSRYIPKSVCKLSGYKLIEYDGLEDVLEKIQK